MGSTGLQCAPIKHYKTFLKVQHVVGDLRNILKETQFSLMPKPIQLYRKHFQFMTKEKKSWLGWEPFSTIIYISLGGKCVTDRPTTETLISL